MAMDQSAPLEMVTALKAADVGDRIRRATEKLYQELPARWTQTPPLSGTSTRFGRVLRRVRGVAACYCFQSQCGHR